MKSSSFIARGLGWMGYPGRRVCVSLLLSLTLAQGLCAAEKWKALIVDGQNNHAVWPKATLMLKQYLEDTGLFTVDIARTRYVWNAEREASSLPLAGVGESEKLKEPKVDPEFKPAFSQYRLVVSNFGWKAANWPEETRQAFEEYMKKGGGLVSVHAANNSWPRWLEFNKMIGLGGWGDRNEKNGPYVFYDRSGKLVRDPSPGSCGTHGPVTEFVVTIRDREHPITRGLPNFWMHSKDECYSRLRGPAENMTVLATACDTPKLQAEGRHEPMLMAIQYHQGRVFHTTLGHDEPALTGVGFIVTFQRGAEWAATGNVTQKIPSDFPTAEKASHRPHRIQTP